MDIRNFFGGGGAKPKVASPAAAASPSKPAQSHAKRQRTGEAGEIDLTADPGDEGGDVKPPALSAKKAAKGVAAAAAADADADEIDADDGSGLGAGAGESSAARSTKGGGGGGGGAGPALPPPIGGTREPRGKPDCLKGQTIVVTGELENLTRDQFQAVVERFGGRVTSGISGVTTMLVFGSVLEDGRPVQQGSKWREAGEQNTKGDRKGGVLHVLSEEQFFDRIESTLPPAQRSKPAAPSFSPASSSSSSSSPSFSSSSSSSSSFAGAGADAGAGAGGAPQQVVESQLWADKYKPQDFSDLVGNLPSVKAIDQWIRNWEGMHVTGTIPKPAPGPAWRDKGAGAKAALISGPPGIGKSTTAALLGRRYGYDVLEMNASDTRAAKALKEHLSAALSSSVIPHARGLRLAAAVGGGAGAGAGAGSSSGFARLLKRLVIMDEVDGMSSGDRGGNAELIKLIKASKVPLICICNDRQSQKVRSLANSCYDIKFMRPTKDAIAKRLCAIAAKEGLSVETSAVEALAESCGGDIRQMLNTLQMWSRGSRRMSGTDLAAHGEHLNKDATLRLDGHSASHKLFSEAKRLSLSERIDLFMVDYELEPLLIHQSYPDALIKQDSDARAKTQSLVKAADCLVEADIYSDYVRSRQLWSLLPSMAVANVRAAALAQCAAPPVIFFPAWFGKNSSRTKRMRLMAELGLHMSSNVSGGREAVRLDYFDPLRIRLMRPLVTASAVEHAAEAANETIALLDGYSLSQGDLMETMIEVSFAKDPSNAFPDYAKTIDSRVKAAFTREYKKGTHRSQSLGGLAPGAIKAVRGKKGRGGKGSGGGGGWEDGEDEDDEGDEEGGGSKDSGAEEEEDASDSADAEAFRKSHGGRGGAAKASGGRRSAAKPKAKPNAAAKGAGSKRKLDDDDNDVEVFDDSED